MELTVEARGDTTYLCVDAERIDSSSAIQFKDKFREAVQEGGSRILLDLSKVEFLDSSGLGAMVAAMKLLGSGRKLEIAGLTPTVEKVFRLTRMDSVFTIHPNADAALAGSSPAPNSTSDGTAHA
jgi:anti-sigma B factor antagonist